jgi:D-alanine-D-alanine ligase
MSTISSSMARSARNDPHFELADLPLRRWGSRLCCSHGERMKSLFRAAGLPIVNTQQPRGDWNRIRRKAKRVTSALVSTFVACKSRTVRRNLEGSYTELGPAIYEGKVRPEDRIEEGVGGAKRKAREIECSVLGNDHPSASVPGEIVPGKEFYDYAAKYLDEGSELVIPAKLSKSETKKIQDLAIKAFQAVDCAGLARVDFLMDPKTRKIYINEINTMPGFTAISMYPNCGRNQVLAMPN